MTEVIENWADVIGTVVTMSESQFEGMATVELEVEEVVSVPGYENLFMEWVGEAVAFEIPADVVAEQEITDGSRIAVRARYQKHNQRAFVDDGSQVGPAPKGMGGAILEDDVPPGGPPPEPPAPEGPKGPTVQP